MTPPLSNQSSHDPTSRRSSGRAGFIPSSAAPGPALADDEDNVLDLDLAVLVEEVHPRLRAVHLRRVRAELDLGVHAEDRLLVVADRLDHFRTAGHDAVCELDKALHVRVHAVEVGL